MRTRTLLLLVFAWLLASTTVTATPDDRQLPYMAGETWWCSQDWYGSFSHSNEKAWDFNWNSGSSDLGMPLLAPANGEIAFAGNTGNAYGIVVLIAYPDGTFDRIAHCQSVTVKAGESVVQGQVVAYCGSSGSDAVHIHINAQNSDNPSAGGNSSVDSDFDFKQAGVLTEDGYPEGCDCLSTSDPQYYYTSLNSNIINLEFTANGGYSNFGTLQNGDGQDITTGIHWYHTYDPNDLYRGGNVPNNCYVQNWGGGPYANCGIVYDALGGARRAYTVRTAFWENSQTGLGQGWAKQGGPTSWLGMPISNEVVNPSGYAEQFFMGGYYRWMGACQANYWTVCAPGWTDNGWDPTFSYIVADAWVEAGNLWGIGEPTGYAYVDGYYWKQPCENGVVEVELPSLTYGGAGGLEGSSFTPMVGDFNGDGYDDVCLHDPTEQKRYVSLNDPTYGVFNKNTIPWLTEWGDATGKEFCGDVNGDGKADAVMYNPNSLKYWVATSTGAIFSKTGSAWIENWGSTSTMETIGDFNNDGKADIKSYNPSSRKEWVALNNGGEEFVSNGYPWLENWGDANSVELVGDCNGDGYDDVITYNSSSLKVWVALNDGSDQFIFTGASWLENWASASCTHMVGDYNHDGKTDIACYNPSSKKVWVALNNGSNQFVPTSNPWLSNWGDVSHPQLAGDFDNDGYTDIVSYNPTLGRWWVALNHMPTNDTLIPAGLWLDGWGIEGEVIGKAAWDNSAEALPNMFSLAQNYPNPFNPVTTIQYLLPEPTHVRMDIFNILGQRVETLVNTDQEAGKHQVTWDASKFASGIYFYKLQTKEAVKTKKMVVLK